jgi:uncharacterized protein YpiB (UPF0302 family)
MNNWKPDFSNSHDEYIASFVEALNVQNENEAILSQKRTRYTKGANQIIKQVQQRFLETRRAEEIDKALDEKNKERFMALTSEGWEQQL